MRWQVKHRLKFIRDTLDAKGQFNRQDLVAEYGISVAQASLDVRAVLKGNPNLMWYDVSAKCYRPRVTAADGNRRRGSE